MLQLVESCPNPPDPQESGAEVLRKDKPEMAREIAAGELEVG
jgi:hypothetical protein